MKNVAKMLCNALVLGAILVLGSCQREYTISVTSNNTAWGTTEGSGTYAKGSEVQIRAIPRNSFEFVKWDDGATDNPRTINVTANAAYKAIFDSIPLPAPDDPPTASNISVSFADTTWNGISLFQFDMEAQAGFVDVWQIQVYSEGQQAIAGFNMPNTTGYFTGNEDNHLTAFYLENGNNDVIQIDSVRYPHWISAKHSINGNVTELDLTSLTLSVTIDAPLQNMADVSQGLSPEIRNLHITINHSMFTSF